MGIDDSNPLQVLPSLGSLLHADKSCMPCVLYFHSLCNAGAKCEFCHIWHSWKESKRMGRCWRRTQWRRLAKEKKIGTENRLEDAKRHMTPHYSRGAFLLKQIARDNQR